MAYLQIEAAAGRKVCNLHCGRHAGPTNSAAWLGGRRHRLPRTDTCSFLHQYLSQHREIRSAASETDFSRRNREAAHPGHGHLRPPLVAQNGLTGGAPGRDGAVLSSTGRGATRRDHRLGLGSFCRVHHPRPNPQAGRAPRQPSHRRRNDLHQLAFELRNLP